MRRYGAILCRVHSRCRLSIVQSRALKWLHRQWPKCYSLDLRKTSCRIHLMVPMNGSHWFNGRKMYAKCCVEFTQRCRRNLAAWIKIRMLRLQGKWQVCVLRLECVNVRVTSTSVVLIKQCFEYLLAIWINNKAYVTERNYVRSDSSVFTHRGSSQRRIKYSFYALVCARRKVLRIFVKQHCIVGSHCELRLMMEWWINIKYNIFWYFHGTFNFGRCSNCSMVHGKCGRHEITKIQRNH